MIFLQRRRFLIWLLRAYLRKWKKTILLFFLLSLSFFFVLYFIISHFTLFSFGKNETIGILGTYGVNNIPMNVLNDVSYGLTSVSQDGRPEPLAATNWSIKDGGKIYVFYIKKGLKFSDGTPLTSDQINYNFEDVKVSTPDKYTITFKLKEAYSPFLITVSRPIFKKNFVGLGRYRIKSINLNGDFVNSITIVDNKNFDQRTFLFYPTEESIKMALLLGEISETIDLSDANFRNTSFNLFSNYKVTKSVNYNKMVTLFYNTQDKVLSDKRLRQALNYSLPNEFPSGLRNRTPYPPNLWVSRESALSYEQDFDHAKLLLSSSSASEGAKLSIKTLDKYKKVAEEIKNAWMKIGVKSDIEIVDSLPQNFQIFLGEFYVSKDPDQYNLWHSDQTNNITGYKNLRIDKLLEDGRQTVDIDQRAKIYAYFQKYLLDDPPAAFLFFPYNYIITKK